MFGERPSYEHLLEEIRQFDKTQTAWFLARLDMLLALGRAHSEDVIPIQKRMLGLLVDDELLAKMQKTFATERMDERQCFHSLQFLLLLKLVLLEGEKTGKRRPDSDQAAGFALGRCLLMANDLLSSDEGLRSINSGRPSEKRRRLALLLQVGSGLEVNNPPDVMTSVARSEVLYGEVLNKTQCRLDIPAVFKSQTGISLNEYVDFIFGTLAYYLGLRWDHALENAGSACLNTQATFGESQAEPATKWWQIERSTVGDLARALANPNKLKPQHDFIAFRRTPFLEVAPSNAIPVHIGFVQEKLEMGLFWTIFNSLRTAEERDSLFTDWGHLFENYTNHILGSALIGKRELFTPFPKFSDRDEESFDGVVTAGDHLFVMEYKGGFLKAEAKYADDEGVLIDDLNRKFGKGNDGGLSQLARKIGQVFAAGTTTRRTIANIDTTNARVVVPILIVQEPFVSSEIIHPFLHDIFGSLKRTKNLDRRVTIVGPLIFNISDIEMMRPYLRSGKISFCDCMMARVSLGAAKHLSFHDFFRDLLAERSIGPIKDEDTIQIFRRVMDRVSRRFFNKPFAGA
jgi:hypothetical protein